MKMFLFSIGLVIAISSGALAQAIPEWSIWKNQRESLIVITTVGANGDFKGTFINNAPNFRCRGVGTAVSGNVSGANVMFVTNFAPCDNTITIWKGTLNGNVLSTRWTLTYVDGMYDFKTLQDVDTFTKIN